jgi:polyvinyl alcohol dehydrogenase (cytochrome)
MRKHRLALLALGFLTAIGCADSGSITPGIEGPPSAVGPAQTTPVPGAATPPTSSPTGPAGSDGAMMPGAPTAEFPGMNPGSPTPVAPVPEGPAPAPAEPAPIAWSMFNYDHNNSRNNRSETKISRANVGSLTRKWENMQVRSGVTSTPIVSEGDIFVGDHAGALYAIDAATGQNKWAVSGLFTVRTGTPTVVGDIVYAAGGQYLYARKRADGSDIWRFQLNMHANTMIDSSPIPVKDKIIVGVANYEVIYSSGNYTGAGAVVAVNAADGTEAWRFITGPDDDVGGAGVSVWSSAAADLARNTIYIGTGQAYEVPAGPYSDALIALDIDSGELKWVNQFHANDAYTDTAGCRGELRPCDFDIGAAPNLFQAQGKDVVGVGSKGGLFRTLERDTGTMVWEKQLGPGSALGGVMAVAAVDDAKIYVVQNAGRTNSQTMALDKETGEEVWNVTNAAAVWGAVSVANGVLYVPTREGILHAQDTDTGMELAMWDLGHDAASGPSISDGVLYTSSGFTGLGSVSRSGAALAAFTLP